MSVPRIVATGLTALIAAVLSGCMTKPQQPVKADGTYCYAYGRAYRQLLSCTTDAVPSSSVEAEAKQFQGDPSALTVYVVRRRWLDSDAAVALRVDEQAPIATVPRSLVRLRLRPGAHQLVVTWDSRLAGLLVFCDAGEVQYVELNCPQWAWRTDYRLEQISAEDGQVQAIRSKLIADLAVLR